MTTEQAQSYNEDEIRKLRGRTVYGKAKPHIGEKGEVTEVRPPSHPKNLYKDEVWGVLVEYDGNIGREGIIASDLLNDEADYWTLEKPESDSE